MSLPIPPAVAEYLAVPGCLTCTQCVSRLAFAHAQLGSSARTRSRAVSESRIRHTDAEILVAKKNVAMMRDNLTMHLAHDHDAVGDAA
jgi:hypothetical protein